VVPVTLAQQAILAVEVQVGKVVMADQVLHFSGMVVAITALVFVPVALRVPADQLPAPTEIRGLWVQALLLLG
jgi:hypothetical protein